MTIERRAASVVFLLGLIVGGALGSWGQRMLFARAQKRSPDPKRHLERLSRELGLEEGQKAAVLAALVSHKSEMDALRKDSDERFEKIRLSANAEIEKSLNPDQRAKFEAQVKRWEDKHPRPAPPSAP